MLTLLFLGFVFFLLIIIATGLLPIVLAALGIAKTVAVTRVAWRAGDAIKEGRRL